MNSYSTSCWNLLLINRPREDERLSWPCWLTYSGRFTHINGYPSAAGLVQTSESSLVRDRRFTTEPPNQLLLILLLNLAISVIWSLFSRLIELAFHLLSPSLDYPHTLFLFKNHFDVHHLAFRINFLLYSVNLILIIFLGLPVVRRITNIYY